MKYRLPLSGALAGLLSLTVPAQDSDLLSVPEWREHGPAAFGGRVVDVALRADDRSAILVASASGGLWRTTNHGTTWSCIFDSEGTISIGDVAWDANDPDVIWVGTGEANNQRSSYWGDGVYRSVDGGKTWKHSGLADSHHIGRIVLHPTRPEVAFVAVLGHLYSANEERGLYRTDDGGESWRRLLAVSPDAGVVDVAVDPRDGDVLYAASYERRRRAWNFDGAGPGSALWRSVDGGLHWERCTGLPAGEIGRIGIALFASNPDTIFATLSNQNLVEVAPQHDPSVALVTQYKGGRFIVERVATGSGPRGVGLQAGDALVRLGDVELSDRWAWLNALGHLQARGADIQAELVWERSGETLRAEVSHAELEAIQPLRERLSPIGGQIFRSDDRGVSWRKVNEKPVGGNPAYYYGQIRVDPVDDQRLYLLGVPAYRSLDGGRTWSPDLARSLHVDHHAIEIDPVDPRRIVLGNDGGVAVSYDRGLKWDLFSNLPIAQFYAVGLDQQQPYHIYGGTQDNGTWGGPSRAVDGGSVRASDWYKVGGGDGFYAQIDPLDPDTVYAESQFGFLYRRDLGRGMTSRIRPPAAAEGEPDHRFNWSSPILVSHHNPRILYFGGNRLFKSFDRGDHWPVVSEDLTTADPIKLEGNVPHCTITTIAESPIDPNLLLVGTDDGLVQRSSDGGLTWTNLAGRFPGLPNGWWVSRVLLGWNDSKRAYATFTGYREDDFRPFAYASDDGGDSWRPITAGLPDEPINVIVEDPANADILYLGTDLGAWASLDRGGSWAPLGSGLPTQAVHDLAVHPRERELVIATHGRGFWILDVNGLGELGAEQRSADFYLCQPTDLILWRRRGSGGFWGGDRQWSASAGSNGARIRYHLGREFEDGEVQLLVRDAAGKQVAELDAKHGKGLHQAHWSVARRNRGIQPGEYSLVLSVDGEQSVRSLTVKGDPRDD